MLNYHLTLKSRNGKTGPIPVSTTGKASCPDCPLKGEGCYADGGPLALFWAKVSDGRAGGTFENFLAEIARLPEAQLWRHNQAGDLPGGRTVGRRGSLAALARHHGRSGRGWSMARSSDPVPLAQPGLMREAAEILGGGWNPVLALAHALEINQRSVQRWLAGQNRVPPQVWRRMAQIAQEREAELKGLRAAIERQLTEEEPRLGRAGQERDGQLYRG